jgi:hypothetical protein
MNSVLLAYCLSLANGAVDHPKLFKEFKKAKECHQIIEDQIYTLMLQNIDESMECVRLTTNGILTGPNRKCLRKTPPNAKAQ